MVRLFINRGFTFFVACVLPVAVPAQAQPEPMPGAPEVPHQLTFLFQKQKDPQLLARETAAFGEALTLKLNIPIRTRVPTDYAASVQALVSGTADAAYIDSVGFLLAERDGGARLVLAEERVGADGALRTSYDSLLIVRQDSELVTLDQLVTLPKNYRVAFTSPTSTSGYLFPYRFLADAGAFPRGADVRAQFRQIAFAGSYASALEQVVTGLADVAAVSNYAFEGPAASTYLSEEKRATLRVLARIPGVPTHVVSVRQGVSQALSDRIAAALLEVSVENPVLLSDVYGAARFVRVERSSHLKATEEALSALGIDAAFFREQG